MAISMYCEDWNDYLPAEGVGSPASGSPYAWYNILSRYINALERSAGVAGSFSNNFSTLTNIITTGATTNYLDNWGSHQRPRLLLPRPPRAVGARPRRPRKIWVTTW